MKKVIFILLFVIQWFHAWRAEGKTSVQLISNYTCNQPELAAHPFEKDSPADITHSVRIIQSAFKSRDDWSSHDFIGSKDFIDHSRLLLSYPTSQFQPIFHLSLTRLLLFPKHVFW